MTILARFRSQLNLLQLGLIVVALLPPSLPAQPAEKPYVILVSMDGFRFDYAERYKAKNILAIQDNGAAAASMIPSFPSVTFPNHITIVTGLYPEHHGIVGNSFYDSARDQQYAIHTSGNDGSWYQKGTPLWVLAEQQHVIAACMFWPTCDGEISGVRPTFWKKYDGSVTDDSRVEQVVDWLKLPPEQRPHFITLYFSDADDAGHRYGPESNQVAEAVHQLDRLIGKLRADLAPLKLLVNLILVSDHGMQGVHDQVVLSPDFYGPDVRIVLNGPVASFYCKSEDSAEKTYQHLKKNSKLDVYRRAETPVSWHYNENPRSGDLVAIVKGPAVFALDNTARQGRGPPSSRRRARL
jgi:predicted AlkP superfamily pyrophosphatase or phosphodiesterase